MNPLNPITQDSRPIKISVKSNHPTISTSEYPSTRISLDKGIENDRPNSSSKKVANPRTTKNGNAPSLNINEPISIMSLLGSQNYVPLDITNLNTTFDKYDQPKISSRILTDIKAYAANTNQGIVR